MAEECDFCHFGKEVEGVCGRLIRAIVHPRTRVGAHKRCMQYSSGLVQYRDFNYGIVGFKATDVLKEKARGKRLNCSICSHDPTLNKALVKGATAGCGVARCNKSFHFRCARQNPDKAVVQRIEVIRADTDIQMVLYRTFCMRHAHAFSPDDPSDTFSMTADSENEVEEQAAKTILDVDPDEPIPMMEFEKTVLVPVDRLGDDLPPVVVEEEPTYEGVALNQKSPPGEPRKGRGRLPTVRERREQQINAAVKSSSDDEDEEEEDQSTDNYDSENASEQESPRRKSNTAPPPPKKPKVMPSHERNSHPPPSAKRPQTDLPYAQRPVQRKVPPAAQQPQIISRKGGPAVVSSPASLVKVRSPPSSSSSSRQMNGHIHQQQQSAGAAAAAARPVHVAAPPPAQRRASGVERERAQQAATTQFWTQLDRNDLSVCLVDDASRTFPHSFLLALNIPDAAHPADETQIAGVIKERHNQGSVVLWESVCPPCSLLTAHAKLVAVTRLMELFSSRDDELAEFNSVLFNPSAQLLSSWENEARGMGSGEDNTVASYHSKITTQLKKVKKTFGELVDYMLLSDGNGSPSKSHVCIIHITPQVAKTFARLKERLALVDLDSSSAVSDAAVTWPPFIKQIIRDNFMSWVHLQEFDDIPSKPVVGGDDEKEAEVPAAEGAKAAATESSGAGVSSSVAPPAGGGDAVDEDFCITTHFDDFVCSNDFENLRLKLISQLRVFREKSMRVESAKLVRFLRNRIGHKSGSTPLPSVLTFPMERTFLADFSIPASSSCPPPSYSSGVAAAAASPGSCSFIQTAFTPTPDPVTHCTAQTSEFNVLVCVLYLDATILHSRNYLHKLFATVCKDFPSSNLWFCLALRQGMNPTWASDHAGTEPDGNRIIASEASCVIRKAFEGTPCYESTPLGSENPSASSIESFLPPEVTLNRSVRTFSAFAPSLVAPSALIVHVSPVSSPQ